MALCRDRTPRRLAISAAPIHRRSRRRSAPLRALLIAFANGREYGIGARIAPLAQLDDGLLDATIVETRPTLTRFWHARHMALGTPHRARA